MEKMISKLKPIMVCLVAGLILSSCAGAFGNHMTAEYRAGMDAAEKAAKADAIKENCIFVSPVSLLMHKNLTARLRSMDSQRTDEFRKGFTRGYNKYFIDFMDLYCDLFERNHHRGD